MKEWDKQTIKNYLTASNGDIQPCDQFTPQEYENYQLGVLSPNETEAIERHLSECQVCKAFFAMVNRTWEASSTIAETIPKKNLMQKLKNSLYKTAPEVPPRVRLAAAAKKTGTAGKAYGVAVADKGKGGTIIKCKAFVQPREKIKGELTILGLKGDRNVLERLQQNITHFILPSCPELMAYNLDRRLISVDLDENLFSTAKSLSLAVIMAIINALEPGIDKPQLLYSARVETFGALTRVERIPEKIDIALANGFKHFIFSTENQTDIPPHHLNNRDLKFHFFSSLQDLFAYLSINLEENDPPKISTQYPAPGHEVSELQKGAPLKSHVIADGNLTPILDKLSIKPGNQDIWRQLLTLAEDLSHTGDLHDELSTAFVLGPVPHIERTLPETLLVFNQKTRIFDIADIIEDLAELIDGQQLCFILDPLGTITSVRHINPDQSHIGKANELLTNCDRRMAALSNNPDAQVIFFPPYQNQVKLFANSALTARYANGQWRLVDYTALNNLLKTLSQENNIYWPVLKTAVQTSIAMAENGEGGTLAFVPDKEKAESLWQDRLLLDFGLRLEDSDLLQLDTKLVTTLARAKGAVIFDRGGRLLATHAYFAEKGPAAPQARTRARHRTSQQFSADTGALCIVASRYGVITIYHKGKEVARI